MKYGLPEETISRITGVFDRHPLVEKAVLYGSRAKGTFANGSDIDLAISGTAMDFAEISRIENEIDDLLLPYSVDLSYLPDIDNPGLIDHIERVGVTFYVRKTEVAVV